MNNTHQIGRLTKDLELKKTPANKSYVHFSIAVNRKFKNADGNYEADFIPCTLWGAKAETLAKMLQKEIELELMVNYELEPIKTLQESTGLVWKFSSMILSS